MYFDIGVVPFSKDSCGYTKNYYFRFNGWFVKLPILTKRGIQKADSTTWEERHEYYRQNSISLQWHNGYLDFTCFGFVYHKFTFLHNCAYFHGIYNESMWQYVEYVHKYPHIFVDYVWYDDKKKEDVNVRVGYCYSGWFYAPAWMHFSKFLCDVYSKLFNTRDIGLDITVNTDIGDGRGSWKGGAIGYAYRKLPNETWEECVSRFLSDNLGQYRTK